MKVLSASLTDIAVFGKDGLRAWHSTPFCHREWTEATEVLMIVMPGVTTVTESGGGGKSGRTAVEVASLGGAGVG
jgi:hypothetical protein